MNQKLISCIISIKGCFIKTGSVYDDFGL